MWHYVYILENNEGRQYVGSTRDVRKRLVKHNKVGADDAEIIARQLGGQIREQDLVSLP